MLLWVVRRLIFHCQNGKGESVELFIGNLLCHDYAYLVGKYSRVLGLLWCDMFDVQLSTLVCPLPL